MSRLIDADALMEVINRHCYPVQHDMTSIEPGMTRIGILQAIQEQPTIEPERKNGKWIEDAKEYYEALNERGPGVDEDTPYFIDEDIACSECLAMFSVIDNETERWNYCPNCGADMRGENDDIPIEYFESGGK